MKTRKLVCILLTLAIGAGVLAGCQSSDSGSASQSNITFDTESYAATKEKAIQLADQCADVSGLDLSFRYSTYVVHEDTGEPSTGVYYNGLSDDQYTNTCTVTLKNRDNEISLVSIQSADLTQNTAASLLHYLATETGVESQWSFDDFTMGEYNSVQYGDYVFSMNSSGTSISVSKTETQNQSQGE